MVGLPQPETNCPVHILQRPTGTSRRRVVVRPQSGLAGPLRASRAAVRRLADNESVFSAIAAAAEPGELVFSSIAERNARTPGYLELFAALTGEASAAGHPAHARMRERYCRLRSLRKRCRMTCLDNRASVRRPLVEAEAASSASALALIVGWLKPINDRAIQVGGANAGMMFSR